MSWQARLLTRLLRLFVKPHLARVKTVPLARRGFRRAALGFPHVPFTRVLQRPGNLWWISAGPTAPRRVLLYFHGGGYIVGSPATHQAMLARLSKLSGVEVCALQYGLAPENPFPGPFEDAKGAWERLIALGYRPSDIVLGGDSAGGGLALALLAHLCQAGRQPAAAFAFSPWTDLTLSSPSLDENRHKDPLLPAERIEELREYHLQGHDPADPRGSPLFASFPSPPPVLLQCSNTEILRDDTLRIAEHLRAAGGKVTLEMAADLPHVWHLFDGRLPEARTSLERVAAFVQESFAPVSR
ncbi:alpha/beta hydrolase fold domain-containing protein [Pacificoceanicola onchidii]|uniref:alpha/beta hydrolase fold domain-containing protein n=1 Tax=Pacificoceanicola onchidii TaxID=2562685 RepID=UPI0010A3A392|nr:alpha/beta hydrolase fold domain-containing protein [Pacificoceanicola onchidii]